MMAIRAMKAVSFTTQPATSNPSFQRVMAPPVKRTSKRVSKRGKTMRASTITIPRPRARKRVRRRPNPVVVPALES